jgi:choline dehydrogenase-like flavoprotein
VRQTASAYDAIVVGAGAAGGEVILTLANAGLRVLVLDAGLRQPFAKEPVRRATGAVVRALADPGWMKTAPPALIRLGQRALRLAGKVRQPVQTRCFAWQLDPEALVDDRSHPYVCAAGVRFNWFRSHMAGGRLRVPGHGRQYYRLSQDVFDDRSYPAVWPFSYEDLDPWYSIAERRLGLCGGDRTSPDQPASHTARVRTASAGESETMAAICARWPGLGPILGQFAAPTESLGTALASGRVELRQGANASRVLVDASGAVCGVSFIDISQNLEVSAEAPLVFLCAGAFESVRILLNSRSSRHAGGIGADSGVLGSFVMDHVLVRAEGLCPSGSDDSDAADGHCVFIPAFHRTQSRAAAPFGVQVYKRPAAAGKSWFNAVSFAEMEPRGENRLRLASSVTDKWGRSVLEIDCSHGPADRISAAAQTAALAELADVLCVNLEAGHPELAPPGSAIHEAGGARMGRHDGESVLDPFCGAWEAPGLFVTDAAAFPRQGFQNPTLTVMALSLRASAAGLSARGSGSADESLLDDEFSWSAVGAFAHAGGFSEQAGVGDHLHAPADHDAVAGRVEGRVPNLAK